MPDENSNLPSQTFNLSDLLRDGSHVAERVGSLTQITNVKSGKVVAVFHSITPSMAPTVYVQRTLASGEQVWTDESTNLEGYSSRKVDFSDLLIDIICQKIAEGSSLTKVCKEPGMPTYAVLCAWKRKFPDVEKRLEEARYDRAEWLRDQAMEQADQATNKNDTPAAALKYEARKWAAGVDNSKYSPKAKVEATLMAPTQIIVHTGIVRDEEPVNG